MKKEFQRDQRNINLNLPESYLAKGYFDKNGNLFEEFITKWAEEIAKKLGLSIPDMKKHQLRRFYNHVKSLERRLSLSSYENINKDLKMLVSYATSAAYTTPPKIPKLFEEFIRKNMELVKDSKTFRAFINHFEAIVGFSEKYLKKN
ncbi:MAG: type III-A CRISPR-associated protein Csm2 [Thermodesulfobacteriota bacterium]